MLNRNLSLARNKMKQRRKWQRVHVKHDARKAQVTELHGKAQPVRRATPLPDDGKIGFAQGVSPDQILTVIGQGKQTLMERELTIERTRAGLELARKLGRKGGRKRQMTDSKIKSAKKLLASGVPLRDGSVANRPVAALIG